MSSMKQKKGSQVIRRAVVALGVAGLIMGTIGMPNAKANVEGICPVYGNAHQYNQHYGPVNGYVDQGQHNYVYYQTSSNTYYGQCVYTRYNGYYYAQCPCGAVNSTMTCCHEYQGYHPGESGGQHNGCGSGWVNVSLPDHLH